MKEVKLGDDTIELGFTLSFPCNHESISVGRLVKWSKGYRCRGVVGKDVVAMLKDAIERKVGFTLYFVCIIIMKV